MTVRMPWLGLAVAAAAALVLSAVQLQPPAVHGPDQHTGALTSLNWAGLAQGGSARSFDSAAASWMVPTARCAPGETSYSIAWVGLDGYSSKTVEQVGTESSCNSGAPVYRAWYELYPAAPVFLDRVAVNPGDAVNASVSFRRGAFVIHMDVAGQPFDTVQQSSGAARSSAEYIVEAPVANGTVVDFTRISPVSFYNLAINGQPASPASMDNIDMVTSSGQVIGHTTVTDTGFTVRRLA